MAQPLDESRPHDVEDIPPAAPATQKLVHFIAIAGAPFAWVQARQPVMTTTHAHFSLGALTETICRSVFIFAVNARCPVSVSR